MLSWTVILIFSPGHALLLTSSNSSKLDQKQVFTTRLREIKANSSHLLPYIIPPPTSLKQIRAEKCNPNTGCFMGQESCKDNLNFTYAQGAFIVPQIPITDGGSFSTEGEAFVHDSRLFKNKAAFCYQFYADMTDCEVEAWANRCLKPFSFTTWLAQRCSKKHDLRLCLYVPGGAQSFEATGNSSCVGLGYPEIMYDKKNSASDHLTGKEEYSMQIFNPKPRKFDGRVDAMFKEKGNSDGIPKNSTKLQLPPHEFDGNAYLVLLWVLEMCDMREGSLDDKADFTFCFSGTWHLQHTCHWAETNCKDDIKCKTFRER